jgi:hypothetical protein
MTEEMKENRRHSRTEIKDLPRDEKELSVKEKKQIQGGADRLVGGGIRSTGNASGGPIDNSV